MMMVQPVGLMYRIAISCFFMVQSAFAAERVLA